jgi:hypothetical protein
MSRRRQTTLRRARQSLHPRLVGITAAAAVLALLAPSSAGATSGGSDAPPDRHGYFHLRPPGADLPSGEECAAEVHRSTWEPRPSNSVPNHTMPDPALVHESLASRPRSTWGTYDPQWDTWLLPRVDGQFTGTTDEIFQWVACKWGLSDNMLRGIAVRESTWYQYETYPSGRCVTYYGCGDWFTSEPYADRKVYCDGLAEFGYDYQQDYGDGYCPKTFSIVGEMSWSDPAWGFPWAGNQNGTFPFNRDSTAFAADYLGASLRGCYNGWEWWLDEGGGDIWGCVGAWYSGDWHSADADAYIHRVKHAISSHRWLRDDFPLDGPPCDPVYGCPTWRRSVS